MKSVLIKASNITKSFTGGAVLAGLSLDIYEGDFTVIMGPSGAGKSTLLYALSAMDRVTSGAVEYKGQNLCRAAEKTLSGLRRCDFGFVFQQPHLVSNLTLLENVEAAGFLNKARSEEDTRREASSLFDKLGVKDARHRYPSEASGGEAQRAAIARAVINRPAVLFADEPTGALNRRNTIDVLDILTSLNRERSQSIVMVTHDPVCALRGTRILYLEDGSIKSELSLGAYEGESSGRAEKFSAWLTSMERL